MKLDAIAAAVIGGTSLSSGVGRITGTVIGTIILGVMTSGFTFLKVGAYYYRPISAEPAQEGLSTPGRPLARYGAPLARYGAACGAPYS